MKSIKVHLFYRPFQYPTEVYDDADKYEILICMYEEEHNLVKYVLHELHANFPELSWKGDAGRDLVDIIRQNINFCLYRSIHHECEFYLF